MPDISSAPGVPSPTALYPQPSQGLDAQKALNLFESLQRNSILQRDIAAKQAIGNAYQGAIDQDGNLDPQKFRAGVLHDPAASWMLPDAMQHVQNLLTTQFNLHASQDDRVRAVIGSLSPYATDEQLRHYSSTLARTGIPPAMIVGHVDALMQLHGRQRADAIADLKNTAIGPAGTSQRVTTVQGTVPGSIPLGQANREGFVAGGLPVGEETPLGESAKRASDLQATGSTTAQYHADLENLRQLSRQVNISGPTAELEKRVNQVLNRLGIPGTVSARQLANAEEFDKIANRLSLSQKGSFGGSAFALGVTKDSNPNLSMSRYGREGVIDLLQGQQDATDALRNMWLNARRQGVPANQHDNWVNEAAKVVDPRLFQFNRLSPGDQAKFWGDMDPTERANFKAKYLQAMKNGWVKSPKKQEPQ